MEYLWAIKLQMPVALLPLIVYQTWLWGKHSGVAEEGQVQQFRGWLCCMPARSSSYIHALALQGLKTGMYYLRTKPAANPIQFTLNKEKLREREKASKEEEEKERNKAAMVCSLENRDECMMCGS